jgi:hypothetical protein
VPTQTGDSAVWVVNDFTINFGVIDLIIDYDSVT